MSDQHKSSPVENEVLSVIQQRKSIRSFAAKTVSNEMIETLFEAARWAPSSYNEQPWRYVYATREQLELWNKMFDTLSDANKVWVKHAPLLIASFAKKDLSQTGKPNAYAKYDLGAANAFLALQATKLGLQVHQMGGYSASSLRENLNVPDDYDTGALMAVGYPGDPEMLPENLKMRELAPRKRNKMGEFVLNDPF